MAAALALGACDRAPAPESSAAPPPPVEADTQAIRNLIARTAAMNNDGDVEGWVALFEDGAVYMPSGQPAVTTREGLREIASAGFTSWRSQIDLVPDEIIVAGDWAFARSTVTGTVTPAGGGDASPVDLKQLVVYHRQPDGTWRIARLIGNTNLS